MPCGSKMRSARSISCTWYCTVSRSSKRSEEHTSELQSRLHLVCRLLLEKKNNHDANERAAIVFAGRALQQVTLLFDGGEFGVALVNDHVEHLVSHLMGANLAH